MTEDRLARAREIVNPLFEKRVPRGHKWVRDFAEECVLAALPTGDAVDEQWQPIETAPIRTPVRVKAGEMTFLARLLPGASMDENEQACDQWAAEIEGEHPPCWSGGACWANNEDETMSLQPTHWRPAAIRKAPA